MRRAVSAILLVAAVLCCGPVLAGGPGPAPRTTALGLCGSCWDQPDTAGARRVLCADGSPCIPRARACTVDLEIEALDAGGARSDQVCPPSGYVTFPPPYAFDGCTCATDADCAPMGGTCLPDGAPTNPRKRCQTGTCTDYLDCPGTACHCPDGSCSGATTGRCGVLCPSSNAAITVRATVRGADGTTVPLPTRNLPNCVGDFARFYCPDANDPDANASQFQQFLCSRTRRRFTETALLAINEFDLAFQRFPIVTDELRLACGASITAVPIVVPPVDVSVVNGSTGPGYSTLRTCLKLYWQEP